MPSKFRTRTIVFTSYDKVGLEDPEAYVAKVAKQCLWCLGQVEKCPESGRLHIQGMAYAKEAMSWAFMKPDHIEACKDPVKSIEYCSKEETRIKGPYESGVRPTWNIKGQKLSNKEILSTSLVKLVDDEKIHLRDYEKLRKCINLYNLDKVTEERKVEENLWIVGQPGVGKSYWVREQYGDDLFLKSQNKWWDGYSGQKNVLIDDFDQGGKCLSHYLKIWGDRYELTGEIKGGTVKLSYSRIIITSNYTIEQLWGGNGGDPVLVKALERRFTVKDMVGRGKFD